MTFLLLFPGRVFTRCPHLHWEDPQPSHGLHRYNGRLVSKHLHFFFFIVFQIFDDDGDGLLSYQEFVAMMKDRIHRGLKNYSRQEGWEGFKHCVKKEMREAS